MINRPKFYTALRKLCEGRLVQSQVDGSEFILGVWEQKYAGQYPVEYLAYCLATTFHETGTEMLPIEEKGSWNYLSKYDTGKLAALLGNTPEADGDGQKYKGRGYVQLTGLANYLKAKLKLGVDFVKNPDKAEDPRLAAQIMFAGMLEGWFTGKKLSDYRTPQGFLAVNARRIINGTDRAVDIAGYFRTFNAALA